MNSPTCALDTEVRFARDDLRRLQVARPMALILCGTGTGFLPSKLQSAGSVSLSAIEGVPDAWRAADLHWGLLGGLSVWLVEERRETYDPAVRPLWVPGFPCWLAADFGAEILIHTSAGSSLPIEGSPLATGSIALLRDHLNLSGSQPLVGLGESALGPMFPDRSVLHSETLAEVARASARQLGIALTDAVAACTPGPSLDTPAERRFYAQTGAAVAVQNLAAPLIAAAHAGLSVLALCGVTDAGDGPVDLAAILGASEAIAPALEDLVADACARLAERVES